MILEPSCGSIPVPLPLGRLSVADVVRDVRGTSNIVEPVRFVRILTRVPAVRTVPLLDRVREVVLLTVPGARTPGPVPITVAGEPEEIRLAL